MCDWNNVKCTFLYYNTKIVYGYFKVLKTSLRFYDYTHIIHVF